MTGEINDYGIGMVHSDPTGGRSMTNIRKWRYYSIRGGERYNELDLMCPPGHRLVLSVRRDILTDEKQFRPKCICSWAYDGWVERKKYAKVAFLHSHIDKVKLQGQLFGTPLSGPRPHNYSTQKNADILPFLDESMKEGS